MRNFLWSVQNTFRGLFSATGSVIGSVLIVGFYIVLIILCIPIFVVLGLFGVFAMRNATKEMQQQANIINYYLAQAKKKEYENADNSNL
jgi:flagellar motor component MotA